MSLQWLLLMLWALVAACDSDTEPPVATDDYTPGNSCCGPSDTCGWAGDGTCDCGGAVSWDLLDCAPVPGDTCREVTCRAPACCGEPATNGECCRGTILGLDGLCIPDDCDGCPNGCTYNRASCEATCNAPSCCGQPAGADGCCEGTILGNDGKCIPDICRFCENGCQYDASTCEAHCAPPACCQAACTTDADCCPGTRCSESTSGGRACVNQECEFCGGMQPLCATTDTATCEVTCIPPPTCGDVCSTDDDCGLGAVCNTFLDGARKCVPRDFQDECNLCQGGCIFHGSTCDVECKVTAPPPEPEELAACGQPCSADADCAGGSCQQLPEGSVCVPVAVAVVCSTCGDAGCHIDAATCTGSCDATLPAVECGACCQPCGNGLPACCDGSVCDTNDAGEHICLPAECQLCSYGCTFLCP